RAARAGLPEPAVRLLLDRRGQRAHGRSAEGEAVALCGAGAGGVGRALDETSRSALPTCQAGVMRTSLALGKRAPRLSSVLWHRGCSCRDPMTIDRRSIDLDGRRVSYLTAGGSAAAPVILLIHGSGVSAGYWIHQLRVLADRFRVTAIDLPGHGKSDPIPRASVEEYAETVAGLLEALHTGPVLVASCAKLPRVDATRERWLACLPGPLRRVLFLWTAQKLLFSAAAPSHAVSLGMQEIRSCRAETVVQDVHAAQAMDLTRQARALEVPTDRKSTR